MTANIVESNDGQLIEVELIGKLTDADYDRFVPLTEERINQHGKIRMIVVLTEFHGWDGAALWEDIKWDVKHFNDIERLAVVGDSQWEKGVAVFCRPFTTAKIKYFDLANLDEARKWAAA